MSLKQLFKKTIIIITLLLNVKNIHAQSWEPLTTGLTLASVTPFVDAMCVYNGKLIVAGRFDNAGGVPVNNIAVWDETDWSPLGDGVSNRHFSNNIIFPKCDQVFDSYQAVVRCLTVYNNELYAGGDFVNADGIPVYSIAKWNGTNWSAVAGGLIKARSDYQGFSGIKDMIVFNNELYVAGSFDSIGNVAASNLAKWNGQSWSMVGGGVKNNRIGSAVANYNKVWTLHAFNNKLYVGGVFDTVGVNIPAKNIAAWDGINWSSFGNGIPSTGLNSSKYLGVTEINDFMGNIYAGNTTTGISKWNGAYWQSVGGGVSLGSNEAVYSSFILNNKLIVTGSFSTSGNLQGTTRISCWDGTIWSHFGPICTVSNNTQYSGLYGGCVNSSIIYNGYLYVAGAFYGAYNTNTTPNCITNSINRIARLSSPVGIAENEKGSKEIALYPNPATNEIHLSLNHSAAIEKIVIRELSGKEVLNISIPNTQETIVNTSDLKPGAYFIEIKTNLGILSKPFMKITE
jgi:hypothetical protein